MTATEDDLRQAMVELAASLFNRGFAVGGAGNISARLPDGTILVTPTNSSLGRLDPARLARISSDGDHLSGNKPSKEVPFHLAAYNAAPGCGAVVHLHSTYLTALSCLEEICHDDAIRPFTPYYVMKVGRLPVLPYMQPGSPAIGEALAAGMRNGDSAFILANHGAVVTAGSLVDAVNNAEELEETAKLFFILGDKPTRHLTAAEIMALRT